MLKKLARWVLRSELEAAAVATARIAQIAQSRRAVPRTISVTGVHAFRTVAASEPVFLTMKRNSQTLYQEWGVNPSLRLPPHQSFVFTESAVLRVAVSGPDTVGVLLTVDGVLIEVRWKDLG